MLQTLVLSVTYRCPIKCKYCGVNAGPHRRETLDLPTIRRLIDEAVSLGTVEVVVFTGGEPFLLGEDLFAAVDYAAQKKFLTRIVTNGYWASSQKQAYQTLKRLKDLGLTEINYSCDDFHQEFIPLQRVKWACLAAEENGIPALIAAKGLKDSIINLEYLDRFFGRKLERYKKGRKTESIAVNFGVTVPVGWESERLSDEELLWSNKEDCWKTPCKSVLESIVVTPKGQLSICCGIGSEEIPETVMGNIYESSLLDLLIQANNDLVINWLALEGPFGIMKHIQEHDPTVKFKDRYVNTCHLCHHLFTRPEAREALIRTIDSVTPVLSLERAWLEHHRDELPG